MLLSIILGAGIVGLSVWISRMKFWHKQTPWWITVKNNKSALPKDKADDELMEFKQPVGFHKD